MHPQITFINLLIVALATARITSLVVFDDILEPVRHRIFRFSPPPDDLERGLAYQNLVQINGLPVIRTPGFIGSLLSCYHCTGVWVAASTTIVAAYASHIALPILTIAAIAQASDTIIKATR